MDQGARMTQPGAGSGKPVRKDEFGNVVPEAGTPEYDAWWRNNMAAQGITGQQGLEQIDAQKQLDSDRARIMAQQPATPATTGQFNPTTTTRPTYQQIFDSIPAGTFDNANTFDTSGSTFAGSKAMSLSQGSRDALAAKQAPMFAGIDLQNGGTTTTSKADQAADQAKSALGPAPQMDVGFADRQMGAYQEALGMSREVLDKLLGATSEYDAQTQSTIDRLLNAPNMSKAMGARALEQQLAVARSARGGPGAVQDALNAAQQQAPQLQAQANQQAVAEENARVGMAGQLAAGGAATEAGRLATAGNVASNFAQAALGARGQDIQIESENTRAATSLMQEISRLTGTQLQLDQQNEQFLGQMARDWAQLDFDFSKMDIESQIAWFDQQVKIYGIDQQTAAQMKAIAAGENIGPADWFNGAVGILGAAAGVGAAAIKGG